MKPLTRGLVAVFGTAFSLLAVLLLGCFVLLFTEAGSLWLADKARQQVPELGWDTMRGTLADGLQFDGLTWQNSTLRLRVDRLQLTGQADCLWRATLCLSQIDAEGVHGQSSSDSGKQSPTSPPEFLLPLPVEIGALHVRQIDWRIQDGSDSALHEVNEIRLAARMRGRQLQIENLQLAQSERQLQMNGAFRFARPWPLQVSANLATELPDVLHDILKADRAELQIELSGNLEKLLGKLSLAGETPAHATLEVQALAEPLQFRADLAVPRLALGTDAFSGLFTKLALELQGTPADMQLALRTRAEQMRIPGQPELPAGQISAGTRLTPGAAHKLVLKYQSDQQASTLQWAGELAWSTDLSARGDFGFRTRELAEWLPGVPGSTEITGSTRLLRKAEETQLDLRVGQAKGTVKDQAFSLQAALALHQNATGLRVRLDSFTGDAGPVGLQLRGTVLPDLALAGHAKIADLGKLNPAARGALAATIRLNGPFDEPRLQLDAQIEQPGMADISARHGHVAGAITLAKVPRLDLQAQLQDLTGLPPVLPLAGARVQVTGSAAEFRTTLHGEGPDSALSSSLVTMLDSATGNVQVRTEAATVRSPDLLDWKLTAPATVHWIARTGTLRFLDAHCISNSGAKVCVREESTMLTPGSVTHIDVPQIQPAIWASRFPPGLEIEDTFSGGAELRWAGAAPELQFQLAGGPGAFRLATADERHPIVHSYSRVSLEGSANQAQVQTQLTLLSESLGTVDATLVLPRADESLSGHASVRGLQLAPLRPLLSGVEKLAGQFDADLVLSGTRGRPLAHGTLQLADVNVSGATLPLQISALQVRATIAGDQLEFTGDFDTREGEEAAAGGQTFAGRGTIQGQATWSDDSWRLETELAGEQLQAQFGGHTSLELNTRLKAVLSPELLQADGSAEVLRGQIRMPGYSGETVRLSDDVVLVPAPPEPPPPRPLPFANIRTSFALELGKELQFAGFGVNGFLTGGLKMEELHTPTARGRGRIQIKDGRYRAYGQRLKIRRGILDFRGALREPWIDAEAIRPLEQVVAGVRIKGPASNPVVTLFSEPGMPEEEILSWLVLGKPLGSGTSEDSRLLSSAILSLGLRGGESIGERMADRLGISQFEVGTTNDDGGAGVYASGYLSPRLFVRYGISGFEATNTLTLRYRMLPQLFLEASSGIGSAVDVLYTFSF